MSWNSGPCTDDPVPDDGRAPDNEGHFPRRQVVQGGASHFGTGFWPDGPPPDTKKEPPRPPDEG